MQGLELLVAVLLARTRPPPRPTVAARAPFAAELIVLPSRVLSKVCEAIVALKVSPGACPARASGLHGRMLNAGSITCGAALDAP